MKVPKSALLFRGDKGSIDFAEEDSSKFRIVGNSGKPFGSGFFGKMIVDLKNLKLRNTPLVVLREHDELLIAGTAKRVTGRQELVFEGKFSETTQTASEIKELLSEGVKFESSIRVEPKRIDFIDKGESAEINGQTVKGPIRILRDNLVSEVSFVLFGQDKNTNGKIVAGEGDETINISTNKELIMSDGKTAELTEQQLSEARDAAAKNERDRIMAITTELAGEELAEVRNRAIAGNMSLAEAKAAAFEVVKKSKDTQLSQKQAEIDNQKKKLDAITKGGGDLSAQGDSEELGETTKPEKNDPNLYLNEVNRILDLGRPAGEAVRNASKRYPESHEAWIKEQRYSEKPL